MQLSPSTLASIDAVNERLKRIGMLVKHTTLITNYEDADLTRANINQNHGNLKELYREIGLCFGTIKGIKKEVFAYGQSMSDSPLDEPSVYSLAQSNATTNSNSDESAPVGSNVGTD
jgi:hypothetical protein